MKLILFHLILPSCTLLSGREQCLNISFCILNLNHKMNILLIFLFISGQQKDIKMWISLRSAGLGLLQSAIQDKGKLFFLHMYLNHLWNLVKFLDMNFHYPPTLLCWNLDPFKINKLYVYYK